MLGQVVRLVLVGVRFRSGRKSPETLARRGREPFSGRFSGHVASVAGVQLEAVVAGGQLVAGVQLEAVVAGGQLVAGVQLEAVVAGG